MSRRLLAPIVAVLLVGLAQGVPAQARAGAAPAKHQGKLDVHLRDLASELARTGRVDYLRHRRAAELVFEDSVTVYAVPTRDGRELLADLDRLGMVAGVAYPRKVTGRLPIASLPAAGKLGSLRFMGPELAVHSAGAALTQGDKAMRADVARASFGVDGTGVLVGSLSDSFNCLGGASSDVSSGDLPPGISVLAEGPCPQTDEGRAMMQLIHDVAPGAAEAFATAENGEGDFANQIVALKNAGAKVINDDIGYLNEPMFQDGIIAQAVDSVASSGVAYFSAAGNEGRDSYESPFRDSGLSDLGDPTGRLHDFDPGPGVDTRQRIVVPPGVVADIALQWDDPFGTVPGSAGPQTDLDIYASTGGGLPIAAGVNDNITTTREPFEFVEIPNASTIPLPVDLVIDRFSGPSPTLMKWIAFTGGNGIQVADFPTNSASLVGHANAAGAFGSAAAFWGNTPAFGGASPTTEPFSSAGRVPILFSATGQRLGSPVVRPQPAFTGPDGGNTTFFGQDIPQDADSQPNFFGTSAAAPHLAGVAALALDLAPGTTPSQIGSAFSSTAVDIAPPGPDAASGAGLVNAEAALRALGGATPPPPPGVVAVSVADVTGKEGNGGSKPFLFDVTLSSASSQPVVVHVATRDGSAHAGSDYEGITDRTVTLSPGQTSATVDVSVHGDRKREPSEQFFLDVTDAGGLAIARSEGTGTIRNDDRRRR